MQVIIRNRGCWLEMGAVGWCKKIGNMENLLQRFFTHITLAKVICLALLFSPLWGLWWFHIDSEGEVMWVLNLLIGYPHISIRAAFVYTLVCSLAFLGFVIVTFIRSSVVRVPLMFIMLIGWAFELSILDLNGTLSDRDLFWILWQERTMASEAVSGYSQNIIRNCVSVIILGIVLCAPPARRFSVSGIFGLLPIASGALVAGVIMYTKAGTQWFPIPFGTFSNAATVLASALNDERDVVIDHDVKIKGRINPIFDKIVMIMDESVRGDYLTLNDPTRNTTPFLKATSHLINFGVASSGANCSFISRTIFRFGMRQSDLPNGWREGLNRPTFWEFAHKAGYKTVHIDAWRGFGSGVSLAERALVDSIINVNKPVGYLRDQLLADKLLHALKEEGPAFIYVDKFGVHYPYYDKYPPDFHTLPAPLSDTVSSVVTDDIYAGERELAQYSNAIAWSVDEFFRNWLPAVDLHKTLIVYTSDHGQSLLPGRFPHCSTTPTVPLAEADVPLFAITSEPDFEQRLDQGAARGFGQFSHFEVFPTLLLALGYDAGWVKGTYGPSLMDSPSPDKKVMIGSPDFQTRMIPWRAPASSKSNLRE
jgi:glucan phosphoethanolaminetransferase (alkaline phosphatase superfamily)